MPTPRFKKSPGPSKLRLRMQANKANRQANRLARKNTDRTVRPDLDRIKTTVDRTNNEYSLKENIDVKKNTTSLKLPENEGLKLKVAEDVKLDTSKSPGYKEYINAQKMKGKVDPKDITDIAMEGKPTISKLEPSMEDHNLAKKNISTAFKKHSKDFNPDLVEYPNAMGGNTKIIRDPKTGGRTVVNTSYNPITRELVESPSVDMMTYMNDDSNKGALKAYGDARHNKMKKTFYDTDAYNIWDTKTKGSGMSYRAGGGSQSFSYSQDYQKPLTKRTKDIR